MGSVHILIIFTVLASGIIFYYGKKVKNRENELQAYKKMLAGLANHVADFERTRISRDLHDEIGTKLGVVKLNLTRISRNPGKADLCDQLIRENLELIGNTIENTRRISRDLMLSGLTSSGYKKALSDLCREVTFSGQIRLELISFPDGLELPQFAMLQKYRIVQEAANNIIRHAGATHIKIAVVNEENVIKTILAHDGIPFSNKKEKKLIASTIGSGLKNMQSRAELINASILYADSGGKSETIISWPYEDEN
jgi:signal transduction histidine kinase